MKSRLIFSLITFGILFLIILSVSDSPLAAQQPNQWSPPQRIPYYDDEGQAPHLLADSNKTVHAFNSQKVSGQLVITYRQWSLDQGWTVPIDILLPTEKKQARIMDVFLDQSGMMHLVFFSGDDGGANIYYSKAPAVHAGQAQAWSAPELIGEKARSPSIAALAGDDKGNLFVVYSGKPDGIGVYAIYSNDAGDTWSEPIPIFLTYSSELFPFAFKIHLDQQGQLHALWTINNIGGNGEAIYYARLSTEHLQWSEPIELAVVEGYEADWASVIEHNNELFVIYQNSVPATRWMRKSYDGGETWTEPVRPFPHVGEYGHAALVVDSNNELHMILGNRIGNPAIHGMWHSRWQSDHWGNLKAIISGASSKVRGSGFDPTMPTSIVSQGNLLLATWVNDHGFNGAWYSYLILDAPELPAVALPTLTAQPSPTPTATVTSPASTPSPLLNPMLRGQSDESPASRSSPAWPLIVGFIPVVLLILATIGVRTYRQTRQPKGHYC